MVMHLPEAGQVMRKKKKKKKCFGYLGKCQVEHIAIETDPYIIAQSDERLVRVKSQSWRLKMEQSHTHARWAEKRSESIGDSGVPLGTV